MATGGASKAGTAIALLKSFKDTDYTITASIVRSRTNSASLDIIITSKKTNEFDASTSYTAATAAEYASYTFNWYACGY